VSSVDFGRTTSLYLNRVGSTYQELLEARMIVEPIMAQLAAQRLTPESAARLSAAVEEGHRAAEASPAAWSVAMELFHRVVAEMSGNHILDMFGGALISIEARHVGPIYPRSHRQQALDMHERLADAILSRDAEAANRLSRDHIAEVARLLKENYAAQLDLRISWR